MGIDIYMRWAGQTEVQKQKQYTGMSVTSGHVGYLREAYHGEPYATRFLVREAFDAPDGEAKIRACVLRERLPETIRLAKERSKIVYKIAIKDDDPVCEAFSDFVTLAERIEKETGEPVTVVASY